MLRLRPYKVCDAEVITGWLKDERAFRMWCADCYETYPISADDMNKHYEEMAQSDSFFEMTAFDETGIVGHLIMRFTDQAKKVLRFGFVIIDDTKRGKGYGKEMLQLALKYAFDILKVEKVTLGVFENNVAAYGCYRAVGFTEVPLENNAVYHILGEDWRCLEMEAYNANNEVFDSKYCFVTYKAVDNVVFLQWKQFSSFENYRRPTTFALELLKKYPGSAFVIDARNGFEDEKEDIVWGFSFLLPEMAKAGCKQVAMIMNEVNDIEGEMDMWAKEFKKYFKLTRTESYEKAIEMLRMSK